MMGRIRQGVIQAFWMAALAAVIGTVFNMVRPAGIPFVGDWSPQAMTRLHAGDLEVIHVDDAFAMLSQGRALFLDAREEAAFAAGHIPGALNIPPGKTAGMLEQVRAMLATGKTVIAYCYDVDCPLAADVVKELGGLGASPIKVMPEGWTGWLDRGYPYE